MSPVGAGAWRRWMVVVTVKNAWVSMARVVQRCQGGPAMPGGPGPGRVLVEAGQAFGGLEGFLDPPALPGHRDQGGQAHWLGCVAAVVGKLARWCRGDGSVHSAGRRVWRRGHCRG